jgi:peroxiredoxin
MFKKIICGGLLLSCSFLELNAMQKKDIDDNSLQLIPISTCRNCRINYENYTEYSELIGTKFPAMSITYVSISNGKTTTTDTASYFNGKRTVLFTVPGAWTPTCTGKHFPAYVNALKDLKDARTNVACLSVNDNDTMKSWNKSFEGAAEIDMICDWDASIAQALKIGMYIQPANRTLDYRAKRGVFIINEDAVIEFVAIEESNANTEVSMPDKVLEYLRKDAK